MPQKLRRRTTRRPQLCPDDLLDYAPVLPTRSDRRSCPTRHHHDLPFSVDWPSPGRPPKDDLSTWTVTDDWPRPLPVTAAEIDVFEAWFGDVFDDLFGPCQ